MTNRYFTKNTGLIRASGKDTIDFINRMSTNDFKKLASNEFRKTVFTTDKGRIIDLVNVVDLQGNILLLTTDNFQDKVKTHLDRYIIMDDVQLDITDEQYLHIVIVGNALPELAKKFFDTEIQKNKIYDLNDNSFLFFDDFKLETLNIVSKVRDTEVYKDLLKDMEQMKCDEYEFIRMEAGMPEGDNELNEQINPVECGLGQYISFTKGCYIGQEVIARLDSQGKIPKQMVKIKSDSELNKNDKIYVDEKEAGFVSSSINYNGKHSGLGFIRSVNLDLEKNYFTKQNNQYFKINIYKIN